MKKISKTASETKAAFSDKYLLENTISLVKENGIDTIFETGTCLGKSTKILSETFPDAKIFSYEALQENYVAASSFCQDNNNVVIRNISSPDGLREDVVAGKSNVLFFLDAHWGENWPIREELSVMKEKGITPVVIVHDFFVPDGNGGSKYGFDSYKGSPLDFGYIEGKLNEIYESQYDYFYSDAVELNSGVIYIRKK